MPPRSSIISSDLDKVEFVLGNIRNHFDGMGGPDKVTIALVVHGPALKAFHTAGASRPMCRSAPTALTKSGLELNACIHTMRAQDVTLKDLLPGFSGRRKRRRGAARRIAGPRIRLSAAVGFCDIKRARNPREAPEGLFFADQIAAPAFKAAE